MVASLLPATRISSGAPRCFFRQAHSPHARPGPTSSAAAASARTLLRGAQQVHQTLKLGPVLKAAGRVRAMAETKAKEVEHIVLFKVKPGNEEGEAAMISSLSALEALPGVKHLHVGPRVAPPTGSEPGGAWTHALYGRYDSKEALQAYADAPEHVNVVVGKVRPICEDVVAVDWEIEGGGEDKGAKVLKVILLEVSDEDAEAVLGKENEIVDKLQSSLGGSVRWITSGKNFAPARAKGLTWGFLAAFSDEDALAKFDGDAAQRAVVDEGLLKKAVKFSSIDFKPQARL